MISKLRKILFFADGARGELAALRRCYGLAGHHGAELVVMGVVDAVSTNDPRIQNSINRIQKSMVRERGLELDRLIAEIRPGEGRKVTVSKVVAAGKDYVEVIRKVRDGGFDLLVKSVHPHNRVSAVIFGNTDIRLMHYCPCPVMILKPLRRRHWKSVLVAIDPDAGSKEEVALNSTLLEMAASIADVEQADLHLLHVLEHPLRDSRHVKKDDYKLLEASLQEDAERKLGKLLEEYGHLPVKEHMEKGRPHTGIARFVQKQAIDLLVMGSVARSGIPGLVVGNTAEKILDNVDCSVLVMKPRGWKTPIS